MKVIKTLLVTILFILTVSNLNADTSFTLDKLFINLAEAEGIEPRLIKAVCKVESNLKPSARNLMDNGRASYGLCQVQLRTARHMGFKGSTKELMTPDVNIRYAARYLKFQLNRYKDNWKRALVAYNKGHYKIGDREVNEYVIKVMIAYKENPIEDIK